VALKAHISSFYTTPSTTSVNFTFTPTSKDAAMQHTLPFLHKHLIYHQKKGLSHNHK